MAMPSGHRTLEKHRQSIEAYAQRVVDFHAWGQSQARYREIGNATPLDRMSHDIERFPRSLPKYGTGQTVSRDVLRNKAWEEAWLNTLRTIYLALSLEVDPQKEADRKQHWWAVRLVRMSMYLINPGNQHWRNEPLSGFQKEVLALTQACVGYCNTPNAAVEGYDREWEGFQQGLRETRALGRESRLEQAWSMPPAVVSSQPNPINHEATRPEAEKISRLEDQQAPPPPARKPRF